MSFAGERSRRAQRVYLASQFGWAPQKKTKKKKKNKRRRNIYLQTTSTFEFDDFLAFLYPIQREIFSLFFSFQTQHKSLANVVMTQQEEDG